MKKEIIAALKSALALIDTEIETNGHPDNFDLEGLSLELGDKIVELGDIGEFEKFDEE